MLAYVVGVAFKSAFYYGEQTFNSNLVPWNLLFDDIRGFFQCVGCCLNVVCVPEDMERQNCVKAIVI